MKVLIVDDNEENLYMLETLLKGNGYQIITARDGLEALERLKSEGADIIISDVLMPRMDGFKLCREVKSDDALKGIPFIFYTATYTDTEDIELGLSLGAERFLIKPQDTDAFLQVIEGVIGGAADTAAADHPLGEEMEFFRQYNEILFKKLEKKISDLKQVNRALLESMHQVTAILNNIPDMAWLKDTEGRFIAVNAPFAAASGLSPQEVAGRTDLDIWPEDLAKLYREDDAEVMNSSHSKRVEERLVDHEGKESWIETIKSPVFDTKGTVIGTTGIARDITVRRRVEVEKVLLEEQLRQAQKMEAIGQLAGGVAHDFNNMLTTIIGYASLALEEMAEDDPNRHNIDQILASSNKAAVLTQSLLAFSRKQVVNLNRLNLNKTLSQFEKFLLRLLREDIELRSRYAPDELPVMVDRGQIEQVLMNLVTNARDAMPKGGRIAIETSLIRLDQKFVKKHGFGEAGEYALLSVSDTGEGMSEDVRRKIFEPFFTTKTEGKGTGLGLAMVYGIVKQHNGSIDVYSEPGVGTTFKIYLPLDRGPAESEIQKDEEQAPLRGGNETILVAEDDARLRQLTVRVLRHHGYTVIEAVDGLDAVAKAMENRDKINLVLLDGIMPSMNGKEVWQEIKALNKKIKVIFMSGYSEDIFTKDGIPGGDTCFIQKPATPSVIVRKIRAVLDE
jgi:PAS domain S-box-containing protein